MEEHTKRERLHNSKKKSFPPRGVICFFFSRPKRGCLRGKKKEEGPRDEAQDPLPFFLLLLPVLDQYFSLRDGRHMLSSESSLSWTSLVRHESVQTALILDGARIKAPIERAGGKGSSFFLQSGTHRVAIR